MDAISCVSAWNNIILQLCYVFTEPAAETFRQIVLGWILRRGPATVTGILRTLGNLANKHWTVYHKFFYQAAWSLNDLSEALLAQVVYPLIVESGVRDDFADKLVAHRVWSSACVILMGTALSTMRTCLSSLITGWWESSAQELASVRLLR